MIESARAWLAASGGTDPETPSDGRGSCIKKLSEVHGDVEAELAWRLRDAVDLSVAAINPRQPKHGKAFEAELRSPPGGA
jgi:hypothetical protein